MFYSLSVKLFWTEQKKVSKVNKAVKYYDYNKIKDRDHGNNLIKQMV